MTQPICMPQLSGTQTHARVVQWLCEEGQSVREGDVVIHLATHTTDIRLPAPFHGVIKEILVDEGDRVQQGDILALLE